MSGPHGRADGAGDEVGFGKRQRVAVRIEDVGVIDAGRIRGQRVRHPRHHPDAPAAIVGVDAADAIDLERERVGEDRR